MSSADLTSLLTGSPETTRLVLDHLPAGLGYFDQNGTLVAANQEFERLLGCRPGRAEEARFRRLQTTEAGDSNGTSPITRALAGETVEAEDLEAVLPDGSGRWVRVSARPTGKRDAPGGSNGSPVPGAVVMLLDVAEARSLDALAGQVRAVVAHDLRNPLSALRMTATMLTKQQEMPTARRVELATRMLGTIGRMEALVSTLIEHAQAERGIEVRLRREPASLEGIYGTVKNDLDILFPGRLIEVTRRGQLQGVWDPTRLSRVMSNLLVNALKYGVEDQPIALTLDGSSDKVVWFSVHNAGPPIPPEFLPQAFQPFSIGPAQQEGRRRTLGLGLFIVEHLVAAHGGQVAADSSASEGTTVKVTLPRN